MKKNTFILLFLAITLLGCKGCLSNFYGVHEKPTPLKIDFIVSKKKIEIIKKFIDSSNSLRQDVLTKYPISQMIVEKSDRIVCLNQDCSKVSLVEFRKESIAIRCIYDSIISKEWWICTENQLTNDQIYQVKNSFNEEVLFKIQ